MNQKDKDDMIKAMNDYYDFEMGNAIMGMILSGLAIIAYISAIILALLAH
jgi:hypothetical protein